MKGKIGKSGRRADDIPTDWILISNQLGKANRAKMISGPLKLRFLLKFSRGQMADALVLVGSKRYTPGAVSMFERRERGVSVPKKYRMSDAAVESYKRLIVEMVKRVSKGKRQAVIRGKWIWHVEVREVKSGKVS